jgi:transposase
MRAAALFEQGLSQAQVAKKLRVSSQSAHRWRQAWEQGGKEALRSAPRKGPPPRLSEPQLGQLDVALLGGPRQFGFSTDLWTLPRIAQVIRTLFGVSYHGSHVWRILQKLGWSCQRPATRAKERNEREIRRWLTQRWTTIGGHPLHSQPSVAAAKTVQNGMQGREQCGLGPLLWQRTMLSTPRARFARSARRDRTAEHGVPAASTAGRSAMRDPRALPDSRGCLLNSLPRRDDLPQ